ncbi:TPA: GT-D fold domain-containing glycosyltransferase [Clostridium perfringens]
MFLVSNIKRKINNMLPDHIIYLYDIIKLLPKFCNAKWNDRKINYPEISFYSDTETVSKIINNRMSMSRFGDGEIRWMMGIHLDSFQDCSERFSNDLKKAFQSKNPNLLIGIPFALVDSSKCNLYSRLHWATIKTGFYKNLLSIADLNKKYCNASITRPYIDYRDYKYSTECFNNLKRIWNNRDIVFVEGEKTKLGMGNDLFDNAKSIKRIICPAKNAYERKEDIKKSINKHVSKGTMIIGALGPTASILASEMTDLGYQFIDIGHVDIEYIWYKKHAFIREEIEGKFVNESRQRNCTNIYDNDPIYVKSIVDKII